MRRLGAVLLLSAAVALAAGCGEAGESATGAGGGPAATTASTDSGAAPNAGDLDGRSFAATTLHGRSPVPGSDAGISFEADRLAVATGCNGISGGYEIADGRLRSADRFQTQMGCDPALTRQEELLRTLLESQPEIALDGRRLTLTGADGSAAVFDERDRPTGPPPIAGTRWLLETIADGGPDGTASSVPAGVRAPTLLIGEDGAVELFAGCNRGGGKATVRDDGFVDFGPLALTRMACDRAAMAVEAAVTAILDGRAAAGFSGDRLVLAENGRSLTFAPAG